jgi:hypothetical protein
MPKANQPAHKVRIGLITATIWLNDDKFYNVVLSRSYKDNNDEWAETEQLSHHDLLNAARVLERSEAWIAEQSAKYPPSFAEN